MKLAGRKFILVSSTLLFTLFLPSLSLAAGTSSANFLKISVGPRASAMGEAFSALADDATAIYHNPAGLAQLKMGELYLMHNQWFEGISQEYLALVFLGDRDAFALSVNYLSSGEIERRSSATEEPEGIFSSSDGALTLSYARYLTQSFSFGLNLKGIRGQIDNYEATGYAADIGFLYTFSKVNLALVVQNLGTEMKFKEEAFSLPLTYKAGLALKLLPDAILALEVRKEQDTDGLSYHAGAEVYLFNTLALRAGYNSKIADTELGETTSLSNGLTVGAGLKLGKLNLDYAFVPYGELGNTQRISLGIKF